MALRLRALLLCSNWYCVQSCISISFTCNCCLQWSCPEVCRYVQHLMALRLRVLLLCSNWYCAQTCTNISFTCNSCLQWSWPEVCKTTFVINKQMAEHSSHGDPFWWPSAWYAVLKSAVTVCTQDWICFAEACILGDMSSFLACTGPHCVMPNTFHVVWRACLKFSSNLASAQVVCFCNLSVMVSKLCLLKLSSLIDLNDAPCTSIAVMKYVRCTWLTGIERRTLQ